MRAAAFRASAPAVAARSRSTAREAEKARPRAAIGMPRTSAYRLWATVSHPLCAPSPHTWPTALTAAPT